MITVKLTPSEIETFSHGGFSRKLAAVRRNWKVEPGRMDLGFDRDVAGCLSEAAWAKHLNIFYCPLIEGLDTKVGDVAGRYQIKSITFSHGALIVRKQDPEHFPYLLALIALPQVTFLGWIMGHDAKQPDHWEEIDPARKIHQAAYFVRQKFLRPMEELDLEKD